MRKIRYKEESEYLSKMAAPKRESMKTRASIGMDSFVGEFYYLKTDKLIPYKNQARTSFNDEELQNLADTIKAHGIRQPLTVIKSEKVEGKFEVVSGERRLRASIMVGLEKVPCVILGEGDNTDEIALIENIQRSDLHPIELARGLNKLLDGFGWGGQTEINKRLGMPLNRISETLKLLKLSDKVQKLAIDNNYRSREKLQTLLKIKDEQEQIKLVCGDKNAAKKNNAFSVVRVSLEDTTFKVQNSGIKKLSQVEKQNLKNVLVEIVESL